MIRTPEARDRVLDVEEMRILVTELFRRSDTVGLEIAKFALLTLQRRNEVAGMRWHEIDWNRRTWTMGQSRTKSRRSHTLPLSETALDILSNARRFGGATYVFPSFRSGVERQLTPGAASDAFLRLVRRLGLDDVHLHDLRRSAATHIRQIDPSTTREVVGRILNHGLGRRDVTGIYDRFDHSEAIRATLDRWSAHVLRQARMA